MGSLGSDATEDGIMCSGRPIVKAKILRIWASTGAESCVGRTGKSMKALDLTVSRMGCWRKIVITLKDPVLNAKLR